MNDVRSKSCLLTKLNIISTIFSLILRLFFHYEFIYISQFHYVKRYLPYNHQIIDQRQLFVLIIVFIQRITMKYM